jgi:hypothetical protein
LAFDIETAKDILATNSMGASSVKESAAAALSRVRAKRGLAENEDGTPSRLMSARNSTDVESVVWVVGWDTLLTWNGLGFDLDVLAEEADDTAACRNLAMNHVDMMFHVFCDRGFPVALDKAAEGLGIPGKLSGMAGKMAPQLWAQGKHQQVIEYVSQDVRIALQIAEVCEAKNAFQWKTRKGSISSIGLPRGWLTVMDALLLPSPDTSWMDSPIPRRRFTQWLERR